MGRNKTGLPIYIIGKQTGHHPIQGCSIPTAEQYSRAIAFCMATATECNRGQGNGKFLNTTLYYITEQAL